MKGATEVGLYLMAFSLKALQSLRSLVPHTKHSHWEPSVLITNSARQLLKLRNHTILVTHMEVAVSF